MCMVLCAFENSIYSLNFARHGPLSSRNRREVWTTISPVIWTYHNNWYMYHRRLLFIFMINSYRNQCKSMIHPQHSHYSPLADLGGGVRDARPPLGVQILSISCSFRENLACSRPPWRVHAPPSGKSWIRHCSPYKYNSPLTSFRRINKHKITTRKSHYFAPKYTTLADNTKNARQNEKNSIVGRINSWLCRDLHSLST